MAAVHIDRLESLFRQAYGDAMRGNMRAGERCRRAPDSIVRPPGTDRADELPPGCGQDA